MPDQPNLTQEPAGGAAPVEPTTPPQEPPQSSTYEALAAKKGFKSQEDLARAYEEVERGKSKFEYIYGKTKQQLESAGYTIDESGTITQIGAASAGGDYAPPVDTPPAGSSSPDALYDPYSGVPLTDPISQQLAKMPLVQRHAFVVNAILNQREQMQNKAYQVDREITSKSEAKGFEDDLRNEMSQKPLELRANPKEWEDALLRVKGRRYEQALKNAGQQGVDSFLNKTTIQSPSGSTGEGAGASLSANDEASYQWYVKNRPGQFKDRAHFLKATMPNGGR